MALHIRIRIALPVLLDIRLGLKVHSALPKTLHTLITIIHPAHPPPQAIMTLHGLELVYQPPLNMLCMPAGRHHARLMDPLTTFTTTILPPHPWSR